MSPWQGLNRRKFPRVKYPCLVTGKYDDGEDSETFLTHTENLGMGGVCIICNKRVKLFSDVALEIDLMDMEEHVFCSGKIVWVVQRKDPDPHKPLSFDVGIEFAGLKEEDSHRVSKIVQRLAKHPENLVE